jgi:ATP phosphoribosyltransferase
MNTLEHSRIKIGGLGRAAIDITITVPSQIALKVLLQYGFRNSGVQITNEKRILLKIAQELAKHGSSIVAPGDPVSNTLHMMGLCQQSRAFPFALHWFGTIGPKDHEFKYSLDPVDSLRRVSVLPHCIAYEEQDNLAVCIISKETKRVITIIAQSNQGVMSNLYGLPVMDVMVVLLLDLLKASTSLLEYIWQSGGYALIVGDTVSDDEKSHELLTELAGSGKLKWVIGRFEEFEKLALVQGDKVHPTYQHVELIGTQGSAPVKIWDPELKKLVSFDVPAVVVEGNEIGAGDAYAGGYLHSRSSQNSIADSHLFATACANLVLQADCARARPEDDLNVVFGRLIDRTSQSQHEGALFERIRISPGFTLASSGQKGVDQIGILAATKLGLPCFCLLPQGCRTETLKDQEIDDFGDSYIMELKSPSYRYRTWVTVFLADGTLLWDFYGGEGSASTRDACYALGRPFLDMTSLNGNDALATVAQWIDRHGIRVINIAGTRRSRLTTNQCALAELQTLHLLKFLAYHRARSVFSFTTLGVDDSIKISNTQPSDPLRIGVANSTGQRALFESFLQETYGISPVSSRNLFVRSETSSLEVVFARSRDLPIMLHDKAIDLALCGSDLLYEEGGPFEVILDTGLFRCFIVLVGKDNKREFENKRVPLRVGSQYPRLASQLLSRITMQTSLRVIHGTAEAWLNIGLLDAAIDTWQTGSSADANNLHLYQIFENTSLVVGTSPSETKTYDGRKCRFLRDLSLWLAGKNYPHKSTC